jgi:hypothetical protein
MEAGVECDRLSRCPYREICNHKDKAEYCSLIRRNCHSLEEFIEGEIRENSTKPLVDLNRDKNLKNEKLHVQPLMTEKLIQWISANEYTMGRCKEFCDKDVCATNID